jgi:hypothetical protein
MTRRYLFGPVSTTFAEQNLYEEREAGNCLAFGVRDGPDLTIGLSDTWEGVAWRLPAGWAPDFVVLYLPYERIPACVWSAPVPVVALAADWNLLWHHYRRCLRHADLVLTDQAGVEVIKSQITNDKQIAKLKGQWCGRRICMAASGRRSAISSQRKATGILMFSSSAVWMWRCSGSG